MTDALADLSAAGVAVWLDDLSRTRLSGGGLQALVDGSHVVGVTTNPSIFQKALSDGAAYDAQVRDLALRGTDVGEAVREKLEEFGLDARAFAGVKVAAVGDATAAALVEFGIRPDLVPSGEQSSEGLLADWAPYDDVFDPIERVFLPRADIATDALVAGLKELGWAVDDITAYRTVRAAPPPAETREALKGGGFDAVLFTSSSTVRNLVGIAGKPHESTVIAVIGPQTRVAAEELGLRVDVQAAKPDVTSLVEALAEHALVLRAAGDPPPAARRKKAVKKPAARRR